MASVLLAHRKPWLRSYEITLALQTRDPGRRACVPHELAAIPFDHLGVGDPAPFRHGLWVARHKTECLGGSSGCHCREVTTTAIG